MNIQLNLLVLAMAALTFCSCASAPLIERAITIHNIYRSVLLDLDSAYVPVIKAADEEAQTLHPNDAAAYMDAMKPWFDATKALTVARQAEQAIHLAIEQAQASGETGKVLQSTYACAADAVDKVSAAFGVLPKGSPLYAAAFAISTQLRQLAVGVECEVKP